MLFLVSTVTCERPGFFEKSCEYSLSEEYVLGMRVARAKLMVYEGMKEKKLRKNARKLASELRMRNVGQVILSEQFPRISEFESFEKADSAYLYERIAGYVGIRASGGGGTAAFITATIGAAEEQSLLSLAGAYRHLILITGRDCEAVCHNLRSHFGVAVIANPTESQMERADFVAILSKTHRPLNLKPDCIVYSPDPENFYGIEGGKRIVAIKLKIAGEIAERVPLGFEQAPIISAAIRHGFCRVVDVGVQDILLDNVR